jgi:hypothetical protein
MLFFLGDGNDMHLFASTRHRLKMDKTICGCKQGVIFAHADIPARMYLGAALANQDIPADDVFTTIFFTPSRFDLLSRPFRDEPPPFLCAMILTPIQSIRSASVYTAAGVRILPDNVVSGDT